MKNTEALSVYEFKHHLDQETLVHLQDIIFLQEVGSTNDYLLECEIPKSKSAIVCMAEQQTAGKGTKGRVWHSRFGASLIYSIAWSFPKTVKNMSALSLAVGVVARQALAQLGYSQVQLKWPNDLLVDRAKLGGVLIEVKQQADSLHLICGIGINIFNTLDSNLINQAFTALDKIAPGEICSRNQLAANLTTGLVSLFLSFPETGFVPWQEKWNTAHALQNKTVKVTQSGQVFNGLAKGVNESGALLVETKQGLQTVFSADITI